MWYNKMDAGIQLKKNHIFAKSNSLLVYIHAVIVEFPLEVVFHVVFNVSAAILQYIRVM